MYQLREVEWAEHSGSDQAKVTIFHHQQIIYPQFKERRAGALVH